MEWRYEKQESFCYRSGIPTRIRPVFRHGFRARDQRAREHLRRVACRVSLRVFHGDFCGEFCGVWSGGTAGRGRGVDSTHC
ncbi:hypothetical protein GCM10009582_34670 [Arthrobacter flavus]